MPSIAIIFCCGLLRRGIIIINFIVECSDYWAKGSCMGPLINFSDCRHFGSRGVRLHGTGRGTAAHQL